MPPVSTPNSSNSRSRISAIFLTRLACVGRVGFCCVRLEVSPHGFRAARLALAFVSRPYHRIRKSLEIVILEALLFKITFVSSSKVVAKTLRLIKMAFGKHPFTATVTANRMNLIIKHTTLFSQAFFLIDRHEFARLVEKHGTEARLQGVLVMGSNRWITSVACHAGPTSAMARQPILKRCGFCRCLRELWLP